VEGFGRPTPSAATPRDAGFTSVDVLPIEDAFFRL